MAYREKDTKKWTAQWFETNVKAFAAISALYKP